MTVIQECAQSRKPKVTVLLSGGVDSTTCVRYYQEIGFVVQGLFVEFGQRGASEESAAAQRVAAAFQIPLQLVAVSGLPPLTAKIRGRNAMLLCLALVQLSDPKGLIALGIHAGTPYEDCSPGFMERMRAIFDLYTDGQLRIEAPFILWDKSQIYQCAAALRVPFSLTYSCETGGPFPCRICPSCLDRETLDAR